MNVWKTYWSFNKWWLYNRKFVRLLYHQKYHKLIGIDLSRETNTTIPQQTIFVEKLEQGDGVAIFLIVEKQLRIILNFSLDSVIVTG